MKRHVWNAITFGFDEANKLEKDPAFQAALEQVEDKYQDAVLNPNSTREVKPQVNFQIGKVWEQWKNYLLLPRRIRNRKIRVPRRFEQEVAESFRGKDVEIVVRRKRKKRSNEQNNYYWGICIPYILAAFVELGNDLQEGNPEHAQLVHGFWKALSTATPVTDANGEEIQLEPSTARLSKMEFMEYLDKVIHFAAERLHIVIPEPGSRWNCLKLKIKTMNLTYFKLSEFDAKKTQPSNTSPAGGNMRASTPEVRQVARVVRQTSSCGIWYAHTWA